MKNSNPLALVTFLCLALQGVGVSAADRVLSKAEYENLFRSSFTYMTVAHACQMSSLKSDADEMVQKVVSYGYKHGLHSRETIKISQNIAIFTRAGIDAYKVDGRITCSDAEKYVRHLISSVKALK